tara:strand:+ start:34 stop:552 length:519 start_codon:yes stop_codon:yes gene_type:complete
MRTAITAGQEPQQVVEAAIRQAKRAIKRATDRIVILESLRPYMRGMNHADLNGDQYARALWDWSRSFAFVREPAGDAYAGEIVQSPILTIRLRAGDCDCMAALIAAAAGMVGMPVMIGYVGQGEGFAHILAAIRPGYYHHGEWLVIDPQSKGGPKPAAAFPGAVWTLAHEGS